MINALYVVKWISPNGAVRGEDFAAARSEREAEQLFRKHEFRGKDGYSLSRVEMLGDLENDHAFKYDRAGYFIDRWAAA